MESKNLWALVLIIFGAHFLNKNLNLLPRAGKFWPLILIILGSIALYQALTNGNKGRTYPRGETWEIEGNGNSPLVKSLISLLALVVVGFVGLIILGIIGPFFLLFLLFLPLILFFRLGFAFLKLLIPIGLLAAPFLLVIWILSLVF
ncbi:MAG: hypothetical protein GX335_03835 [Firmicutes bacterium]|nr:hypothetical protein [Bacillota bacterium]